MKKLLFSLIALTGLALTTQAQTEKGTWTLGGDVELNTGKVDGNPKSNVNWLVEPTVGYFVAHNFEVGTAIGYSYDKSYSTATVGGVTTGESFKTTAFVVAPYARAYKNITDQFKFFGQLSVPMSFGKDKTGDANGDNFVKTNSENNVGVALSPGFAFYPSKSFGIEFSVNGISYNTDRLNDANGDKISNDKSFNIGANFFAPKIGVKFFL
ncbi:outer membrane beta-barrel protein [Pedobacter sp. L105]|uniref:outer membrane beta-barrel protein n=1 Tax=Pedobacter sp. L105 TaxID=1641871 RepID=UPI00131AFF17|nr:outer membrane beta-barrel protein [Pedobacter sp. L105]